MRGRCRVRTVEGFRLIRASESFLEGPTVLGCDSNVRKLLIIAALQVILYGIVAWLSARFAFGSEESARPILLVLALFAAVFACYLYSIRVALQCNATWRLGAALFASAAIFRVVLLLTPPIQEIDIYRYLWDGAATASGINPYRYAPAEVLVAKPNDGLPGDLQALVRLRDNSPSRAEILRRIHFSELSTIYPPVSQAVFAADQWLMPSHATLEQHALVLKAVLTAFDLATVALVWMLLTDVGHHPGLTVAYAWCPLVIKEIANSGHLDSIAVFLTSLAVWCIVRLLAAVGRQRATRWGLVGAVALALAIGAKLYAVVLIPVLGAAVAGKLGFLRAAMYAVFIALVAALCLAPMLLTFPAPGGASGSATSPAETDSTNFPNDAPVADQPRTMPATASGLTAFMTRWEMNDFLFMIAIENLRPSEVPAQVPPAWFAISPESWRRAIIYPLAEVMKADHQTTSFVTVRALTAGLFVAISLALAWRVMRNPRSLVLLEATFLTLAWFWLLSPTQNPWYWIWAMPFLPFARGRAWYAMSGLVMVYYLRFWLQYHYPGTPVAGSVYGGTQFFDFVITWVEYLPWFAWLAISGYRRRKYGPGS